MEHRLYAIMDALAAYGLELRLAFEGTLFFSGEGGKAMAEVDPKGKTYLWLENFSNWRVSEFTGDYRTGLQGIPAMAERVGFKEAPVKPTLN